MDKPTLQLFGADWCTKSSALRNYMQSKWIVFEDYNVETDMIAAEKLKKLYEGKLKFPTIIFGDNFIKNPTINELNRFLEKHDLLEE